MDDDLRDWSEISIGHLFYAFRKAKVDCFYERSLRVCDRFVSYERDLVSNLEGLLARIHESQLNELLHAPIGEHIIFPKKVGFSRGTDEKKSHAFFSDGRRAFERIAAARKIIPEFRIIGDFPVETHILSALWVNLIGHKFDAALSPHAMASRVRRYRASTDRHKLGNYHREAIGTFEPYFTPYRQWRDGGLAAMEQQIRSERPIVAMTLDVSNFYHSIDPKFFADERFHRELGIELNAFELDFTRKFAEALNLWSMQCAVKLKEYGCDTSVSATAGIPIGLSIVRIISNSIMISIDREISENLGPIYYARYVDDIFLVLPDRDKFSSQEDVWKWISERANSLKKDETGDVEVLLPAWGGKTKLKLQSSKQKCFFLSGKSGLDLLNNIAVQIREVSSERRLMPLPEQLDQTQSARALAATETAEEADSLRRADGLTVRRLGWSILMRSVEALARDLRAKDWASERDQFYEFAHDHIIRPDKILEQLDHLPRLFAVAVSLGDWRQANRIYYETIRALSALRDASDGGFIINGLKSKTSSHKIWDQTEGQIQIYFSESLVRAYPVEKPASRSKSFFSLVGDLGYIPSGLEEQSLQVRERDWARISYKEHLSKFASRLPEKTDGEDALQKRYHYINKLEEFLTKTRAGASGERCSRFNARLSADAIQTESILPYLFPTRPYTAQEIALYLPSECVFASPFDAAHNWADYTRAVRGVWVRSHLADEFARSEQGIDSEQDDSIDDTGTPPELVSVGMPSELRPIKLGITSFRTTPESWSSSASGTLDLSPDRYGALAEIVNQAVRSKPRPDYLLLPELSLPEPWIRTVAGRLRDAGISLIAGLDYSHHSGKRISSSAVLVLGDDRLGFPSSLEIRQLKELPAPAEEEDLLRDHGRAWINRGSWHSKPVYVHKGFYFGVLVCSELQDLNYRRSFQGSVDCVMVLSWNRDLETFSALVDAASLDVHAYIALVNNLLYGDSRVRSPAKQSFDRDICRVRGGLNDQLVVVEVDARDLRAQQSREKRWPKKTDRYKPAPEGFIISDLRRTIPK